MEITRIEPFLSYFEGFRARTRKVVMCIPPERLEWSHREGAFTLGDRTPATVVRDEKQPGITVKENRPILLDSYRFPGVPVQAGR